MDQLLSQKKNKLFLRYSLVKFFVIPCTHHTRGNCVRKSNISVCHDYFIYFSFESFFFFWVTKKKRKSHTLWTKKHVKWTHNAIIFLSNTLECQREYQSMFIPSVEDPTPHTTHTQHTLWENYLSQSTERDDHPRDGQNDSVGDATDRNYQESMRHRLNSLPPKLSKWDNRTRCWWSWVEFRIVEPISNQYIAILSHNYK